MFQTKEQDKTPEEQLSEVEIGNLPEKDIRGLPWWSSGKGSAFQSRGGGFDP